MADLTSAKKTRAAARGWLTRASTTLEQALQDADKDEIEDLLEDLHQRIAAVQEAQHRVEQHLDEDDIEQDVAEASDILSQANKVKRQAKKILKEIPVPKHDSDDERDEVMSIASSASRYDSRVRLPKLELPKFSGNIVEWQPFWDKFSAIVDNSDMPEVTKFTYLDSLLMGEAKATIQGLTLSASHYRDACDLLQHRYGRKEKIVFSHIQSLLTLNIPQQVKIQELWKLQDSLLSHVRSLENLGIEGKIYGVVLTPLILSRLPHDIRMEWAREGEGNESDLEFLLKFLDKEIQRRERSETFKGVGQVAVKKSEVASEEKKRQNVPTAMALQAASESGLKQKTTCGFCQKPHPTWKCWEVSKLPVRERVDCVKRAGLCFVCFAKDHKAKYCNKKCFKCEGKHNAFICDKAGQDQALVQGGGENETPAMSSISDNGPVKIVLQTARVFIQGQNGVVEATVCFDSGADRSYISSRLVKQAGLKWVSSECTRYACFGGSQSASQDRNVFKVTARNRLCPSQQVTFSAVEVPVICQPMYRQSVPLDVIHGFGDKNWADDYSLNRKVSIDLLVGLDMYWKLMSGDVCKSPDVGLLAQESVFGWVLSGVYSPPENSLVNQTGCQLFCLTDNELRSFWELDSIGIREEESVDCHPSLEQFQKTVSFQDNRYEVSLPWKSNFVSGKVKLCDNYYNARVRMSSLNRKLDRDPALRDKYDSVFESMEQSSIIEEVPKEEVNSGFPIFYLPHRPVVKEERVSTKVRPVFDASACGTNGISLNDCLEAGPSLLPSLVEVLIRFRRWKVALSADISKAFLQLVLQKGDRDVHRFLWFHEGRVKEMRFLRVTFGVKSSPFLLNATIRFHLQKYDDTLVVQELKENLYVDDWLTGCDSEDVALEMFSKAKQIMSEAGMILAKWQSNCKIMVEGDKDVFSGPVTGKILGVEWMRENDAFGFGGFSTVSDSVVVTKRVVLSFLARLFDPLGFVAPFVMTIKIIFQRLWQLGVQWDEEVPPDLQHDFLKCVQDLEVLKQWQIPRSYHTDGWSNKTKVELCAFGDASPLAFGACVYIRVFHSESVSSNLVTAKGRVAPIKKVTLPRLELLGSLLAARLLCFVKNALHLPEDTKYVCYTDSKIALAWIKGSPHQWKPFVANRVSEIQSRTSPAFWSFCPGEKNPADLITRGLSAGKLVDSVLWLHGPEEIMEGVVQGEVHDEIFECEEESVSLVTVQPYSPPALVFDFERWSSFPQALRIVGYVYRFIKNCRLPSDKRVFVELSYEELAFAKLQLIRSVQEQAYGQEMSLLKREESVAKSSAIFRLDPFISDGLLRVKGRLQHSALTFDEKHPIILPKCYLSLLLVRFQHELMKHAGTDAVICALRNTYWIVGVRRLAKSAKRLCLRCKKLDVKQCCQVSPPLPELRVQQSPPFSVTGVDFAGPMFCCDFVGHKFYLLLFTCAVMRGVHLELVDSLSLESFLLAFRRFSARRGLPAVIYSDNAKTFQGAQTALLKQFGSCSPSWKFIVPRSPWWGGWWERMVRTVKSSLKRTLGRRSLKRTELETLLHEIEGCVNSRPLTATSDDIESFSPITPAHFLIGRTSVFQIPSVPSAGVTPESLGNREVIQHEQLERFWQIWSKDYLRSLPPFVPKFEARGDLKEGSVVLIREDSFPRLSWPIGVVSRLIPGRDGKSRSMEVKTSKGKVIRPVQRLHNLEINNEDFVRITRSRKS